MHEGYDSFYDYDSESMVCMKCNEPLQKGRVVLEYLGSSFPVALPICPKCHRVFIDENLVDTKIYTVEKSLEDK